MKYIFCDTETTGLSHQGGYIGNEPIVLAFVIADDRLNVEHRAVFRAKPYSKYVWSEQSEEIHGITYKEASRFGEQKDCCIDILHMLDRYFDGKYTWVEHSLKFNGKIGFDLLFTYAMFMKQDLQYEFYKYINIDTSISTVTLGKKAGYHKNSLNLWAERLNIMLNHHDAESDVNLCYELYSHLTQIGGGSNDTGTNVNHVRGKTNRAKLATTGMQDRLI